MEHQRPVDKNTVYILESDVARTNAQRVVEVDAELMTQLVELYKRLDVHDATEVTLQMELTDANRQLRMKERAIQELNEQLSAGVSACKPIQKRHKPTANIQIHELHQSHAMEGHDATSSSQSSGSVVKTWRRVLPRG